MQEGILGSSQPGRVPGQAACSGRCSGWSPAEDRNSNGSILPTLSLPANQLISPWNGGPSPPGQGPGPPPLQSSTSAGVPSLGRAWGGTCTWPDQERKVTHTKFNNQQRHILAASCSPQAVPPPRVQSLWPAPNSLLGPEERAAGPRCVSLLRLPPWHLLDRRWREGGGLGLPPPRWGSPG